MNTHKSYNLKVENNTYTVTETSYDDDDKPMQGVTKSFNSEQEAQEYLDMADQNKTNAGQLDSVKTGPGFDSRPDDTPPSATPEKPASEMTEQEARNINADVHVAGSTVSQDRVITDGEIEQTASGKEPKVSIPGEPNTPSQKKQD